MNKQKSSLVDFLEITGPLCHGTKIFFKNNKKIKKEAQERLMGDVGGTGHYNGRHQATIVHLWQDLDSFLKIICVKSVITGSKMKQRWRKAKQMQPM